MGGSWGRYLCLLCETLLREQHNSIVYAKRHAKEVWNLHEGNSAKTQARKYHHSIMICDSQSASYNKALFILSKWNHATGYLQKLFSFLSLMCNTSLTDLQNNAAYYSSPLAIIIQFVYNTIKSVHTKCTGSTNLALWIILVESVVYRSDNSVVLQVAKPGWLK